MKTQTLFTMTQEVYSLWQEVDAGICLSCGEVSASVLPATQALNCDFCNTQNLHGLEVLLAQNILHVK